MNPVQTLLQQDVDIHTGECVLQLVRDGTARSSVGGPREMRNFSV